MTNLIVFNLQGKPVKKIAVKLEKTLESNLELLSQAILVEASNLRRPIASTKTRGKVRGGGAKPWRQKGTGRARAGSIRSPLWRGGGIVFGPKAVRNFKKSIPQKMKAKAFRMVLGNLIKNQRIALVKNWQTQTILTKTKDAQKFLEKLSLEKKKLLALIPKKENKALRIFRNLPGVKTISPESLSLKTLFEAPFLLMEEATFKDLEKKWLKKPS